MSNLVRRSLGFCSFALLLTLSSCKDDISKSSRIQLVTTDASGDVIVANVGVRLTGTGVTQGSFDTNLAELSSQTSNEFSNSLFSISAEVPKQLTNSADETVSSMQAAVALSFDNVIGNLNGFNNGTYEGSITSVQLINTNEFAKENWQNYLATLPEGTYEQPSLAPDNDLPGTAGWGFATAKYKDVEMSKDVGTAYYQYFNVNTLIAGSPKLKDSDMAKQDAKLQNQLNADTQRQLQLMQGEAAIKAAENQQPGIIYPGQQQTAPVIAPTQ